MSLTSFLDGGYLAMEGGPNLVYQPLKNSGEGGVSGHGAQVVRSHTFWNKILLMHLFLGGWVGGWAMVDQGYNFELSLTCFLKARSQLP